MAKIEVNKELCKECRLCLGVCPFNLLVMSEEVNSKGFHYSTQPDSSKCTGCKMCAIMCPDTAISVYK